MKMGDESYGQVSTHCVEFDDERSTLMTGGLKLWPNGTLLQTDSWCQNGKTCEPNAVSMLKQ